MTETSWREKPTKLTAATDVKMGESEEGQAKRFNR